MILVSSCAPKAVPTRTTVQYVRDILADKSSFEYTLLADAGAVSAAGDVYVFGPSAICEQYVYEFIFSDRHDNVDGSSSSDSLPDFAGETLVSVVDNEDVAPALDSIALEAVRTNLVHLAIASVDSRYHMSRFDAEGIGEKAPAKIIVLADPFLDFHCAYDLDTLFRSTGCAVELVSPLALIKGKLPTGSSVACAVPDMATYAYPCQTMFEGCFVTDSCACANPLRHLLDRYSSAGNTQPLDYVVVIDPAVDAAALNEDLSIISSVMNEEYLEYGHLLSRNFECINPSVEAAECCYALLRESNAFTHNISFPAIDHYISYPDPATGSVPVLVRADLDNPYSYVQD